MLDPDSQAAPYESFTAAATEKKIQDKEELLLEIII